uniref:C2 domain-containing protein n=1 Tax=Chromera velia CCMP2878 TaxID=1169474 RepID=A0A0G4HX89_9ALVE|eukprot:Cvel_9223.t1-p1 / transcript=Cvel_9223.t1 / gene=Cvel_9223 / organism=Chromera_velia_CCMP2878 / gene_product=Myoferlin, putative / transcript_product=Myoferlin, putative / location=Cvel_scaffold526:11727-25141(+) / protein_length=1250 / sequence_SO=supercontig / SO=protein_coding / is_pseudo=false
MDAVAVVNRKKTHQVAKKWLNLVDGEDPETKGQLRVTVFAVGPGQTPPSPDDIGNEEEDAENKNLQTLDAALLQQGGDGERKVKDGSKLFHLNVTVFKVEDLSNTPNGDLPNPFVTCEFAGFRLSSTNASQSNSHMFNETFRMPVVTPVVEDSVIVRLWDSHAGQQELIAQGRLSFDGLKLNALGTKWFNFYGFDKREGVDFQQAFVEKLERQGDLLPAQTIPSQVGDEPPGVPCCILADVYEVTGLPGQRLSVSVSVGPNTGVTQKVPRNEKTDSFVFSEKQGRVPQMAMQVPMEESQQWDVIVSVYAEGKGALRREQRIGYKKIQMNKIPLYANDYARPPVWVPLKTMPHINAKVGFVICRRLNIVSQEFEVRCYVYSARELTIDSGALPSPSVSGNTAAANELVPQWIMLRGGKSAGRRVGDILVCLDVVQQKDADRYPPQSLWPDRKICTLHFSLYGLRDLHHLTKDFYERRLRQTQKVSTQDTDLFGMLFGIQQKSDAREVSTPVVQLSVSSFADVSRKAGLNILEIPFTGENKALPAASKEWRTEAGSSFDFFSVHKMEVELPEDPVFDPRLSIRVFDGKAKAKNLVGERTERLFPLMPWLTPDEVEAASSVLEAREDFHSSIDLKKLGGVQRGAKGTLKAGGKINLAATVMKEADQGLKQELEEERRKRVEKMLGGASEVEKIFAGSSLLPSGLPEVLQTAYKATILKSMGSSSLEVPVDNMFALNVKIPHRFVVTADGAEISRNKQTDKAARPSVYGTLEEYLSGQMSHSIDGSVSKYALDTKKFPKKFRDKKELPGLVRVRLYVIRAMALAAKDSGGTSDPFLQIVYGNIVDNGRSAAKEKTLAPQFYRVFEKDVSLPEQTRLDIQVWDRNEGAHNDRLIGATSVDLETRWFSSEWRDMMQRLDVPTEYRTLYDSFFSRHSTGTVELWLELLDASRASEIPRSHLKEPAPIQIEIRLVVWGTKRLKLVDGDHTDGQIKAALDCRNFSGKEAATQETDVHYSSTDGNTEYNWRMRWSNIDCPVDACVLQISAWDFNNLTESVFIGEVNLELNRYVEKVARDLVSLNFDSELTLINSQVPEGGSRPTQEEVGAVQVSLQVSTSTSVSWYLFFDLRKIFSEIFDHCAPQVLFGFALSAYLCLVDSIFVVSGAEFEAFSSSSSQVMTQSEANSRKVGLGRDEPNRDPKLMVPLEGRGWDELFTGFNFGFDFGPLWFRLRLVFCVFLLIGIMLILFLYPALAFQQA